MLEPPYPTVLKPYGSALVELARERPDVVCLGADLTRQTETDLFRDDPELGPRFVNVGMAEANLMGIAGGLARSGHTVFVHSFGVFVTRRAYDQVAMAIAYPALDVKIVGFMPGVSSPGGPSHQAIDDVALMRSLPNMTVVDVADAVETEQVVRALADRPGPAYLRLKRGEIPVIFDSDHTFSLDRAQVLRTGDDVTIVASGMMLAGALAAAAELEQHGVGATVINAPVIKPLDAETVVQACLRDVGRRQRRESLGHRRARVGGRGGARRGRRRPSASPRRARGRLRRVRQPAVSVLEVRARRPAHRRPRVGGRVTRRRPAGRGGDRDAER